MLLRYGWAFFILQREEHPLKQGLRLCILSHTLLKYVQREEHPLKQGLRLNSPTCLVSLSNSEKNIH